MRIPSNDFSILRPAIVAIARRAAVAILEIYEGGFAVRNKVDRTPLTEADERSEAIIVAALRELTPGLPVVAEESQARGETVFAQPPPPSFWLVDPLDGTREFVDRNGQFAINIGLIQDGRPVLGVILVPIEGIGVVWHRRRRRVPARCAVEPKRPYAPARSPPRASSS